MSDNEFEEVEKNEQPQDEREEIENAERLEDKKADRVAWIRFIVLHVLVLIPLAIGLGCLIGGTNSNNHTVAFVGMLFLDAVLPAVMAILVAVVLVWKYRSVKKSKSETTVTTRDENEQTLSQREREQNMIDAVNSTSRMASRANMSAYEMDSIVEGMKYAPKWGLPVGLACFFSLFALLIVATVLLIKRIFVGAIVCAAIVGVILITTFIVMTVSRAKATNGDIRKAKKITEGKVKACFMIGTTTMKTGGMRNGNGGTVRITGVTYRVIVDADGEEYGAFSKQFYESGENVTVAVMGRKRAKIVEDDELETIKPELTTDNDSIE